MGALGLPGTFGFAMMFGRYLLRPNTVITGENLIRKTCGAATDTAGRVAITSSVRHSGSLTWVSTKLLCPRSYGGIVAADVADDEIEIALVSAAEVGFVAILLFTVPA
jgi:hypothetical protein